MIDVRTVSLPTRFEKTETYEDSRFQKVKIYIAHTGENLNHSIFSHEVLEQMIPTLSNIPILGYVGVNKDGEEDFRGHEKKLSIDGNNFKVSFETHAYGFVPEDNNAHFEITGGKEWLVTDGYLWTRFVDSMQLFDESNGSKGQSMEIGNADGYTDDRGRIVFTNATFTGLCILGNDVPPAMTGSTISTVFSKEDFKSTFEEMLAEFSAEKGENALATKKKSKDEAVVSETVKPETPAKSEEKPASSASTAASSAAKPATSSTSSSSATAKEPASEDKKESAAPASTSSTPASDSKADDKAEDAASDSTNEEESTEMSVEDEKESISLDENESAFKKDEDEDDEDENDDSDNDDEDKKKAQFELNLSDRERAVSYAVRDRYEDGVTVEDTYPLEVFDDYGIFRFVNWSKDTEHLFRIEYSVNADDSIKLGDKQEVFSIYVTGPEKDKIESDRVKLASLEAQIKELTDYKNGIEMQAKEKALDNAKDALTSDQFTAIKEQFEAKTPEEIEKEIAFAIYTRHKEEVVAPSRGGVKAMNVTAKEDYGYGSANELFHK